MQLFASCEPSSQLHGCVFVALSHGPLQIKSISDACGNSKHHFVGFCKNDWWSSSANNQRNRWANTNYLRLRGAGWSMIIEHHWTCFTNKLKSPTIRLGDGHQPSSKDNLFAMTTSFLLWVDDWRPKSMHNLRDDWGMPGYHYLGAQVGSSWLEKGVPMNQQ